MLYPVKEACAMFVEMHPHISKRQFVCQSVQEKSNKGWLIKVNLDLAVELQFYKY